MNNNVKRPLVSIVLPAYNHEKFIESCIRSVTEQTYSNLEVIVINDGSKDSTKEKIEALLALLNDPRVQFINQENLGPSATINKGIKIASGELVTILNTDDIYYPSRIEKLVSAWRESQSEFIFTKVKHIDADGNPLESSHPHKKWYDQSLMNLLVEPSIGFALLKTNSAVTTGNFFFSKRLFNQLNGFSSHRVSHDLDFILRALLHTEPLFIPEELMGYRVHGNNDIITSSQLIAPENDSIKSMYFNLQLKKDHSNTIAPTEHNWPHYFFSFLKSNNLEDIYKKSLSKSLITQANGLNTQTDTTLQRESIPPMSCPKGEISLITHELSLTGAPALIHDLAHQLRLRQYTTKVYSPKNGPLAVPIENDKIPLTVFKHSNWIEKRNPIKRLIALTKSTLEMTLLVKGTVVLNSIANWPLLIPLYLNPRVRKIYFYLHEDFSPHSFIQNTKARRLVRHILSSAKANLWFGSAFSGKIWEELGYTGKVKYFSGFDLLPENNHTMDTDGITKKTTFLFVGTFSARKGVAYLFDAFSSLSKITNKPFELKIVGVDTQMDDFTMDLLKRIHYYNEANANKIYLYPQQSPAALESFYKDANIYISASLSECIPLAILNAMRHNLPIITTDVGGCSEAVVHEKNGYVVQSRDVSNLQKHILYFLNNPERILTMGNSSKEIFKENFENSVTIDSFVAELDHT